MKARATALAKADMPNGFERRRHAGQTSCPAKFVGGEHDPPDTGAFIRHSRFAFAHCLVASARAEDVKLPPTMTFTAYDTGSAGFNIAVAVGKMLKDKYGTDVRVLPAGNDVARLAPLQRQPRAVASAMGIGTYFAQEGVFEFASRNGARSRCRCCCRSVDCNGVSLGVAKDTGVKEVKDLKGKRIGFVVGSPALEPERARRASPSAALTQSDVKLVEFASYGAMWKGMVNNDVDAAYRLHHLRPGQGGRNLAARHRLAADCRTATSRGLGAREQDRPVLLPAHGDLRRRHLAGRARSSSAIYPYPIFIAYASQPADLVYAITKAMIVGYDAYKDAAPGAAGLAASRQTWNWVIPFHAGAVKALKEAGQWTAEHEAHNQRALQAAGRARRRLGGFQQGQPASTTRRFLDGWMKARADALAKARHAAIGFE